MSEEMFKKFMVKLLENEEFAREVFEQKTKEDVQEVAKESGFELTLEEIDEVAKSIAKVVEKATEGELAED